MHQGCRVGWPVLRGCTRRPRCYLCADMAAGAGHIMSKRLSIKGHLLSTVFYGAGAYKNQQQWRSDRSSKLELLAECAWLSARASWLLRLSVSNHQGLILKADQASVVFLWKIAIRDECISVDTSPVCVLGGRLRCVRRVHNWMTPPLITFFIILKYW